MPKYILLQYKYIYNVCHTWAQYSKLRALTAVVQGEFYLADWSVTFAYAGLCTRTQFVLHPPQSLASALNYFLLNYIEEAHLAQHAIPTTISILHVYISFIRNIAPTNSQLYSI
jgi:hypothetical protein